MPPIRIKKDIHQGILTGNGVICRCRVEVVTKTNRWTTSRQDDRCVDRKKATRGRLQDICKWHDPSSAVFARSTA